MGLRRMLQNRQLTNHRVYIDYIIFRDPTAFRYIQTLKTTSCIHIDLGLCALNKVEHIIADLVHSTICSCVLIGFVVEFFQQLS